VCREEAGRCGGVNGVVKAAGMDSVPVGGDGIVPFEQAIQTTVALEVTTRT
jgi:hypothetical protein